MSITVTNNSGVINTGSNVSINNTVTASANDASIDWAAVANELEELKKLTNIKSLHSIADEASATVKEKNYSKLVSVLKKMGEVGLDILQASSLVIIPALVKKALGLGE